MRAKKEINIQIGEQVKYAREQFRMTQEQLAEHIEVSPQFVSDMERGVVGISLATLKRVCKVLRVTSDQILFGSLQNDRSTILTEKCKHLTEKQFFILLDIIDKYTEALELSHP